MNSLVAMLQNGEVQGQVYAAGALTRMAANPDSPGVQEQIVAAGAIPHLISIMKDNCGAAPTAAGLRLSLLCNPALSSLAYYWTAIKRCINFRMHHKSHYFCLV